jgi:hypothetical protein
LQCNSTPVTELLVGGREILNPESYIRTGVAKLIFPFLATEAVAKPTLEYVDLN